MSNILILPNQLFNLNYLDITKNYVIYEHPDYFTKYNFNKKKLVLHRASMLYYYDYLKSNNISVEYIEFHDKLKLKNYSMFDPINKLKLKPNEIYESPNFFLLTEDMHKYNKKSKSFYFNPFYMWAKKLLNILPNVKSQDEQNRNKLDENIKIPPLPSNKNDDYYIIEASEYVNKYFPDNYGTTDNFQFPITHQTANKWLNDFIQKKFKYFGTYQDAITKDDDYLFHSCLSTSINIGLLNPLEIWNKIEKVKNEIPLNSFEGYVRQLFWREYQRYCYIYCNFNKNYFNNKNKLDDRWYNGGFNIEIIDDCIIKGFKNAYLHHIERLMVIGNFMTLNEISPKECFKWFMEFSCDSYEWVMNQNVLDMVCFVTGGKTTKRPYIASSNYLLKMSNYKKGEWTKQIDNLYYQFIEKHKKKLYKFRYFFP